VLKAMAKEPGQRYLTAEQMAEDLRRFVADRPILARRISPAARAWRWARRNRVVASLLALLAVVLVGGFAVMAVLWARAERSAVVAQDNAETARRNEDLAVHQAKIATERAEELRRQDYVSRVNLAFRECLDNNVTRAIELLDGCPRDLRGFEWQYAWRQCHLALWSAREERVVNALAFSPDGLRIACGTGLYRDFLGGTGDLVVREATTGRELFAHRQIADGVRAVAFSPDGRLLATGSGSILTFWEAATGRLIRSINEAGALPLVSLAFSPDGRRLIAGYGQFNAPGPSRGHARLWDPATGQAVGDPIPGQVGGVLCVAYSPDGRQIALTATGLLEVWDVGDDRPPKRARTLRGHEGWVYSVAFSPDGKFLASSGLDRTVRIWDRDSGEQVRKLVGHRGFVLGVAFSADSRTLASVAEDKSIKLWSVTSDRELASLAGHEHYVNCVAFNPDGRLLATGSVDQTLKLWAATPDTQLALRDHDGWVGVEGFSLDGRAVLTRSMRFTRSQPLTMWDAATGEPVEVLPAVSDEAISVALSPDGRRLAYAGGLPRPIRLYEMKSGREPRRLEGHTQAVSALAFRPDGLRLAAAGWEGRVTVWDVATCQVVLTFRGHDGPIQTLAWSGDGKRLATGFNGLKGHPGELRVWDAQTGAQLVELRSAMPTIYGIAFHPGGRQLVTAGGEWFRSGQVKVWDLMTRRELRNLPGHTDIVFEVVFSPDGSRLATAGGDRMIKLWDAATYQDVFTLRGHIASVLSLAFSPDGTRLVSGSMDRTALVWDTNPPNAGMFYRREAAERIAALYRHRPDTAAVIHELQADATLPVPVRQAAVEIAGRFGERYARLNWTERAFEATNQARSLARSTAGRRLEALEALHRARGQWDDLLAAEPNRGEYKFEIALILVELGKALGEVGRADEADRAFDRAFQLAEDLRRDGMFHALKMYHEVALGILEAVGNWERTRRRLEKALGAFRAKLAISDEADPQLRNDMIDGITFQKERVQTLTMIGDLQRRIGRRAEALHSSRRAAVIAAEFARYRRNDLAPLISWGHTLDVLARLEREVGGAVSAETLAALDEFSQQLERFPDPRDAGALRARTDFQGLLLDLAFPADPFAHGLSGKP
jgi:WD40 repeat protein/tetratricopeptide (TPR) repeat protein